MTKKQKKQDKDLESMKKIEKKEKKSDTISKQILDKYAVIVVEKDAIFKKNGFDMVNMKKKRMYSDGGYSKDIILWIPPLDSIRIEFEDVREKNNKYIVQLIGACKAKNIDYCVTDHGGKSAYLNIFNMKGIPVNEYNKLAKMVFVESILPSGAKKQLDRTNLGWTLSPVIGHPHWKTKYNGKIHKIIEGKNPLEHENEYPKELLGEFKKRMKLIGVNKEYINKNTKWVEDFLLNYCCNNKLPPGQRHYIIEKNLANYIIDRQDREQIEETYLKTQEREGNTINTWYAAILTGHYNQISPGELYNYIKDNELDYHVEWKEEDKEQQQIVLIDNYQQNVELFYKLQPFFYDKSKIFWFWNKKQNKYEIVDDTDVMIMLDDILGLKGQTINAKTKNSYLEAFQRVGRRNHPKNAPEKWLQFKDKAYSINSKNIYDVTPKYFFTNPIPWNIGGSEETPILDKLLEEWVGKDQMKVLYELIAYCCYRKYPIQLLFCLWGNGRNGKSQFLNILNKFLGDTNTTSTELDLLAGHNKNRFEVFKLYKKLACFLGETNFGLLENSSLLKKLCGGDKIGYEKKGKDPFDDVNYAKIIIASNSLPSSIDTSDGFYRRWMIVDFPNEFEETGKPIWEIVPDEEYKALANKITKIISELLNKGKFENQGSIEYRKQKYISVSNPFDLFLKEYCFIGDDKKIKYSVLYSTYLRYLSKNKRRRVSRKEFAAVLDDEGLYKEKNNFKDEDGNYYSTLWVMGLRLCDLCDLRDYISTSPSHREANTDIKHKGHISHTNINNEETSIENDDTKPTKKDLIEFIKERKTYDMNEFSEKYGEDVLQKLLSDGDIFEYKKGRVKIL